MKVHQLTATQVHTTWSADHQSQLTVQSGDEVEFQTRDGFDGQLDGLSPVALNADFGQLDFERIAPLTGPIAVEGARPGDAVRVDILELAPRGPGWTVVWPAWAGFDYHRPTGIPADGRIHTFSERDLQSSSTVRLGGANVPIRPMLGMVGVAPAHGHFGTLPPRQFGGNMDLREIAAGSAVRLPVLVDGAQLSIGDGHAAQGDGELCTTAIECAMEGRLRITIEPDAAPSCPEVETGDAWIVTGIGRTLDEAVKMAIDGMHSKLRATGMDPIDAYMLLSLAGHIGVNQVVNLPHVGARVMLDKDVLQR